MKRSILGALVVVVLQLSGCVIESRPHAENPQSPTPPPPPPPPPAPPGTEPVPSAPETPPEAARPPPSGKRETMRRAPLPPDRRDPPSPPTPLPPQPPPVATPAAPPRVAPTITEDITGAPAVSGDHPRTYWIWRTPEGVWKLRTTTGNVMQQFHGTVHIKADRLSQLRITRTELERRVDVDGNAISFDFATKAQIEGIDFTTEKPLSCVYFRLFAVDPPDRINDPKDVFIGPRAIKAPNGFILCPKR